MQHLPRLCHRQTRLQLLGGGDAIGVNINAGDALCAQRQRRRRKKPAATANVEKVFSDKIVNLEQLHQRSARRRQFSLFHSVKIFQPILTKGKGNGIRSGVGHAITSS